MKVIVQPNELQKYLGIVQPLLKRRAINDVIKNVKLTAQGERLVIEATDTTITAVLPVQAKVVEEGVACCNGSVLYEIVRQIDHPITLQLTTALQVLADTFSAELVIVPPEDFPSISQMDVATTEMNGNTLAKLIRTTYHSAAKETEFRAPLQRILLTNTGSLTAIATNGRRMSIASSDAPFPFDRDISIPLEGAVLVAKLAMDRRIQLGATENSLVFLSDLGTIYALLPDFGKFPDVSRFLELKPEVRITVARSDLSKALRIILPTLTQSPVRRVSFALSNELVSCYTLSAVGQSRQCIPAKATDIIHEEVGFFIDYIFEMLDAMQGDTITIGYIAEDSPVIFTDGFLKEIIMPFRQN